MDLLGGATILETFAGDKDPTFGSIGVLHGDRPPECDHPPRGDEPWQVSFLIPARFRYKANHRTRGTGTRRPARGNFATARANIAASIGNNTEGVKVPWQRADDAPRRRN